MKTLNKYSWLMLFRGIILIILAIMVFRHPIDAMVGIAIYLSITLLLTGLIEVYTAIATKQTIPNWGWGLAVGLIDIFFAFVLLSNPAITAA